jgi:DNA-binding NtrC family response regulator
MAKLLIADAEINVRQCLTRLLSGWGHQVLVAENSRAALENELFELVGDNRTTKLDTGIVVASNRDLSREIAAGRFRSDLHDRLSFVSLRVPVLREHMEDLMPLAEQLLAEVATRNNLIDLQFSEEAKRALIAHKWPGNIRELREVVECSAVRATGKWINHEDLPDVVVKPPAGSQRELSRGATLRKLEEEHIRRTIAQTPSLEDAAHALGIGTATLWRKRKRYRIE